MKTEQAPVHKHLVQAARHRNKHRNQVPEDLEKSTMPTLFPFYVYLALSEHFPAEGEREENSQVILIES